MLEEELEILGVPEIPSKQTVAKGQLLNITSNNVTYFTHVIHKYPAKFIPHIPRWAINKYLRGKGKLVLDPFCGSGTTLVEASINSHHCVGIDIDPLALLISKVKTTKIPKIKLDKTKHEFERKLLVSTNGKNTVPLTIFKPNLPTLNHWFNEKAIKELGLIRGLIEKYKDDKDLYDFLIITFSSVIRKVSNADNQSQKTYVSHTRKKNPAHAIPLFLKNFGIYANRLIEYSNQTKDHVDIVITKGDARDISAMWKSKDLPKVDLAITSPPYIKAIDYIYNQMVEYFWIGDIFNLENQSKQNRYKVNYVGTKYIPASAYNFIIPKTNINQIDELVDKIKSKNVKHAYIVAKFFIDLEKNFREVKGVLKRGAHYIMVIGNNKVSDYDVPSHLLLIECARKAGLKYVNHFGYVIRNRYMRFPRNGRGGIINEDWILDFINE